MNKHDILAFFRQDDCLDGFNDCDIEELVLTLLGGSEYLSTEFGEIWNIYKQGNLP